MDKKETLSIKNFLIIKEANFDVKKINVIIGPQASGKSIIAKLIYFFREILSDKFLELIIENKSKKELIFQIESLFNQYFPEYTWERKAFEIQYSFYGLGLDISKSGSNKRLKININNKMSSLYKKLKSKLKKYRDSFKKREENDISISTEIEFIIKMREKLEEFLREEGYSEYPDNSIFIPAGRSFFANVQRNIFSLLRENANIDPFINIFGSHYQFVRERYEFFKSRIDKLAHKKPAYKEIIYLAKEILKAEYVYKDGQDWLKKDDDNLIRLAHASSGQQEAVPMLLILSVFPILMKNRMYFIEEPEAHLFPEAQKHIVSIMSIIYNLNNSIFITTHSPYILVAFNNLILAKDVLNDSNKDKIFELVSENTLINFDDVSAYTIEDGILKSIRDEENRLIGVNIIDSVSDEFNNLFDKLLEIGNIGVNNDKYL